MPSKQPTARRRSSPSQQSASTPRASRSAAGMDERLAALERLVGEQAAQLARQQEVIAAQGQRLATLGAANPAPTAPHQARAATPTRASAAPERRSRRTVLRLGGMAAAAGAAAMAGAASELAHPGVAHAAPVAWQTGTVNADVLTNVLPLNTFTDVALLAVTVGNAASPAHPLTGQNKAAIIGYDTTVAGQVGIYADSINGTGVIGHGDLIFGVSGISSTGTGINGVAGAGTGAAGSSTSGVGVAGTSTSGLGASFAGGLAPLLLAPASAAGAPNAGAHTKGEIYLDSAATVWVCTANGTPGTWARLIALQSGATGGVIHLLASPIRIFDTRQGQPAPLPITKAPLAAGSTTSIQVTGTMVNSISVPASATAVIGNLTVTNTQGPGDLILFPTGTTQPLTSNINYNTGQTVANFATVGLSASGQMSVFAHVSGTDALFDVAGYVL